MKTYAILGIVLAACVQAEAISIRDQPLRSLLLPRVAFTNASLASVAESMEQEYAEHAKDRNPSKISIVVHPSCTNLSVSLDLEHVSVHGVLRVLDQMYGISKTTVDDNIILSPRAVTPMISRVYDVLPSVFTDSRAGANDVAGVLIRLGVRFPQGASVHHDAGLGKLFVTNTEPNLESLEDLLAHLNVVHRQVELNCRVVLVNDPTVAAWEWQAPPVTNMAAFISKATTLFWLTTVASSGQTASNRIVCTLPSSKPGLPQSEAVLQFAPAVSPEGQLVTVPLSISLAMFREKDTPLVCNASSTVSLYNGATVFFWLAPPTAAGGARDRIAVLLSVRLVGPDGLPVTLRGRNLFDAH